LYVISFGAFLPLRQWRGPNG